MANWKISSNESLHHLVLQNWSCRVYEEKGTNPNQFYSNFRGFPWRIQPSYFVLVCSLEISTLDLNLILWVAESWNIAFFVLGQVFNVYAYKLYVQFTFASDSYRCGDLGLCKSAVLLCRTFEKVISPEIKLRKWNGIEFSKAAVISVPVDKHDHICCGRVE